MERFEDEEDLFSYKLYNIFKLIIFMLVRDLQSKLSFRQNYFSFL